MRINKIRRLVAVRAAACSLFASITGWHAGGEVVATGAPEEIAACKRSHTGRFLKAHLRA